MKKDGERERIADGYSRVRLPHSALMHPIGEGGGAAWASLYIYVLWLPHCTHWWRFH